MNLNKILKVNSLYDLSKDEYDFLYEKVYYLNTNEDEMCDIIDFLCKELSNPYNKGLLSIIRRNVTTTENLQIRIKAHHYLRTLTKPS